MLNPNSMSILFEFCMPLPLPSTQRMKEQSLMYSQLIPQIQNVIKHTFYLGKSGNIIEYKYAITSAAFKIVLTEVYLCSFLYILYYCSFITDA